MVGLKEQQETGDTQLAGVPKGIIVLLGREFHANLECGNGRYENPIWLTGCH